MIEQDRFAFNKTLYFIGMISLLGALLLFFLSLYSLPYLVWSFEYEVMAFLPTWKFYWVNTFNYSEAMAGLIVFLTIFIPALILGVVADIVSNYIDKQLLYKELPHENEVVPMQKTNIRESLFQSLSIFSKIIIILLSIMVLIFFLEWLISTSAPQV